MTATTVESPLLTMRWVVDGGAMGPSVNVGSHGHNC